MEHIFRIKIFRQLIMLRILIYVLLLLIPKSAFASEKLASAGSKQGPEIFVQMGQNFCDKVQLKV